MNVFYRLLNIEKEEAGDVLLFLSQSVFLGLFYGALDVAAYALFLDVYPATMLPKAYIVSGIFGILLTSLYTTYQSKIRFSRFALINLLIIAILAIMLRSGFFFLSRGAIVFVIFVLYTPLNIVATLGFWGGVGRTFNLRQGKRIFGLIDSGQILGIILSSYGATALISFHFQTRDLLFVSSVSIVLALLLQTMISRRLKIRLESTPPEEEQTDSPVQTSFLGLLKNKYILFLAIFASFSMIATFFIHYSFVSVAKDSYPDTDNFAKFIGAFTGTMMIFSLLIKTFVYGRLMKTYGLRTILLLSPLLLSLFTGFALLLGSTMGYTSTSGNFLIFFLVISLTKLFSKTLKDSFEIPSFKILYQSINSRIRFSVQSRIDGTVNEISALSSGLLLAGLASLAFIRTIHFVWVLLLVLVGWIYVAARLYKEYRNSLQDSLASYEKKADHKKTADPETLLLEGMQSPSSSTRIHTLELARTMSVGLFEQSCLSLFSKPDKDTQEYAMMSWPLLPPSVQHKVADRVAFASSEAKNPAVFPGPYPLPADRLEKFVKSKEPRERSWAAFGMQGNTYAEKNRFLKILLRDPDPAVKIAALICCGKDKLTILAPNLVEYLAHPTLFSYAFDALLQMGETVADQLEIFFAKSGTEEDTQLMIIRLYRSMQSSKVKDLLLIKMESFQRRLSTEAINALKSMKHLLTEEDRTRVFRVLHQVMARMAWINSLQISLLETKKFLPLLAAIQEEIRSNYETIMELLALAYDERSVMLIRENLDSGTREGAGYALELMDIFVDDELKRFIFPLFEDNPPAEKLRVLQEEYPVRKHSPSGVIKALLNRNRNEVSLYTKLVALLSITDLTSPEVNDGLVAHLFNPDIHIAETSAWIINSLNPELLPELLARVDEPNREELVKRIETFNQDTRSQLFASFITSLRNNSNFASLTLDQLMDFAVMTRLITLHAGDTLELATHGFAYFMLIVVSGDVQILHNDQYSRQYTEGEIVLASPSEMLSGRTTSLKTTGNCQVAILDNDKARTLLFHHPEYFELFYTFVNKTQPVAQTA